VRAVWKNELGGLTFQVGLGDARQFVKWTPAGSGIDLSAEVVRLRWAAPFTVVPRVVDEGADETGSWIVTAGLPGRMAVDDHWKRDPGTAVRAIGTGLRALHEQLPVADCPFGWSAEQRLETARSRAAAGRIDPADWPEDFQHIGTVERALGVLAEIPPVDEARRLPWRRLRSEHPDRRRRHVQRSRRPWRAGCRRPLGRPRRRHVEYAWNYGPGWEEPLLEAYGVEPDPERIRYYRLLWELSD
jgi:aminoglycoside phosphotransferase